MTARVRERVLLACVSRARERQGEKMLIPHDKIYYTYHDFFAFIILLVLLFYFTSLLTDRVEKPLMRVKI
jgi:hypothetical protein